MFQNFFVVVLQRGMSSPSVRRSIDVINYLIIIYISVCFYYIAKKESEFITMNKPKFSLEKAQKTVEISSKIEGHKIKSSKPSKIKRAKSKSKN